MRRLMGTLVIAVLGTALTTLPGAPQAASFRGSHSAPPRGLVAPMNQPAPTGAPAYLAPWGKAQFEETTYPVWSLGQRAPGSAAWRVVTGTGNCCENRLAVTPRGRLIDFGGQTPKFSDDDGATWTEALPAPGSSTGATLGEGDVVAAPNGDIVGISWYMLGGDTVISFKYEAALEEWFVSAVPVHQPFFDRPELTVVPGPVNVDGEEAPYAVILKGGSQLRTIYYVSVDGLNYTKIGARLEETMGSEVQAWMDVRPDPILDWVQSHEWSGLTPLAGGRVLSLPSPIDFIDETAPDGPAVLDLETLTWAPFELPQGQIPLSGRLLTDSRGRLHHALWAKDAFTYRISSDAGRTWAERTYPFPAGYVRTHEDSRHNSFKVNGKLGIAAVAIHARRPGDDTTRDFVFKLDVSKRAPRLVRTYAIGLGDGGYGAGVEVPDGRYDFANIAILPDGRLATSFADLSSGLSALAIER